MKTEAMVLFRHGGPEVLERATVDLGEVGPHDICVRIHAVAMNHMDLWVRRGGPHFKLQYPHRLGCDIAGTIESIGSEIIRYQPGDRVMLQPGIACGTCHACLSGHDNFCGKYRILGENAQGGYSRHIIVSEVNIIKAPANISLTELSALPLCTITAWQMVMHRANVQFGQTVIVHAAGSGVSSIIIQICKSLGAYVVATTTSAEKVEKAKELGADAVIVTSDQDYVSEIKRITNKKGADIIFDHVGGALFEKALLAIAWGGKIVTCGATAGFSTSIDLRHVFFRQVQILGSTMGSKADLLEAIKWIEAGRIRPVIDHTLSLWDAARGHEILESRKAFGKVVFEVD